MLMADWRMAARSDTSGECVSTHPATACQPPIARARRRRSGATRSRSARKWRPARPAYAGFALATLPTRARISSSVTPHPASAEPARPTGPLMLVPGASAPAIRRDLAMRVTRHAVALVAAQHVVGAVVLADVEADVPAALAARTRAPRRATRRSCAGSRPTSPSSSPAPRSSRARCPAASRHAATNSRRTTASRRLQTMPFHLGRAVQERQQLAVVGRAGQLARADLRPRGGSHAGSFAIR